MMCTKRPYLEALGIPLWLPRRPSAEEAGQCGPPEHPNPSTVEKPTIPLPSTSLISARDEVPVPNSPRPALPEKNRPDFTPAAPNRRAVTISQMDWEELTAEARQCQACGLCATRTQVVFGVGHRQAEWLVIGEGPGADEDRLGEPFVGRAGQLLNPMLLAIGLKREQVYITNIVRCRPPDNREPTHEEATQCRPFLNRQIALIRPRIILAVGRIAAQNLLVTDTPIGKLRGQIHRVGPARIPLVVVYHPAYLLRSPREKRRAWDDLRLARRALTGEPSV